MPHNAELVYEAQSLEELFDVLEHSQAPALPHGGWVRIHPDRLSEPGLEEYVSVRARAALFGLRLVVTPYVSVEIVELRRRSASPSALRVSGEGD